MNINIVRLHGRCTVANPSQACMAVHSLEVFKTGNVLFCKTTLQPHTFSANMYDKVITVLVPEHYHGSLMGIIEKKNSLFTMAIHGVSYGTKSMIG